jgi:hypothetical protein
MAKRKSYRVSNPGLHYRRLKDKTMNFVRKIHGEIYNELWNDMKAKTNYYITDMSVRTAPKNDCFTEIILNLTLGKTTYCYNHKAIHFH